jgi:hypothetical protein
MVSVVIQVCTFRIRFHWKYLFEYLALKIFKNGEVAEDYNGPREASKH